MKKIFISLIVILSIILINNKGIMAQCQTKKSEVKEPTLTVTYLTPVKINPLIEQVKLLVDGDENLTEEVIYQLRLSQNRNIKGMVSDEEYENMSDEQRSELVKESDVIQVINNIKN